MGIIVTRFEYDTLEKALAFSSYYSDLLASYNNKFDSNVYIGKNNYLLEFKIYDVGGKSNDGDSEGTRHLPESGTENS